MVDVLNDVTTSIVNSVNYVKILKIIFLAKMFLWPNVILTIIY